MSRILGLRPLPLTVELTHSNGSDGRNAELRIGEPRSGLIVARVSINPQRFYELLSGLVSGEPFDAELIGPSSFQRVGMDRYFWTRKVGYGVDEMTAVAWAESLRTRLNLDTATVNNRQGGLWVTWELWTPLTPQQAREGIQHIRYTLDQAELPGVT